MEGEGRAKGGRVSEREGAGTDRGRRKRGREEGRDRGAKKRGKEEEKERRREGEKHGEIADPSRRQAC